MMRMFRKDEGFTLVELMVVVLIIGILVAIAIPVFNAASRTARQRTCHSNQRTIEGAVQQWQAALPTNIWSAKLINGADELTLNGAYIKDVPRCPIATATQFYATNTSGTVTFDGSTAWLQDGTLTHGHFGATP